MTGSVIEEQEGWISRPKVDHWEALCSKNIYVYNIIYVYIYIYLFPPLDCTYHLVLFIRNACGLTGLVKMQMSYDIKSYLEPL